MAGKGEGGSHPRMSAGYPGGTQGQSHEEHKGAKESAREMMSQLREGASQGMEKARETAEQVRDKSREFASAAAGQAQEMWHRGREGVREGLSRVSDRAGDIWEDAVGFVRRYPIASVAAAFGLGCLVSAALTAMSVSGSSSDMTDRMSRSSS
jgi:ElaB/YqjD/DUF883 family membrane-anchored ribosome-binding protein